MSNEKSIYHYCSLDTFMAIVQNKCLRLSDLNKTNDYMEKRWAMEVINSNSPENILKEKLKEFYIDMNLNEDYWYDDGVNNHLEYYDREVKNVLFNNRPILITCFSKEKDLLSQWRAYGEDGKGVSIGFNYKLLKKLNINNQNIKYSLKRDLFVDEVMYKQKQQQECVGQLIEECIRYVKSMFEEDLVRVSDDFSEYFVEEFDAFCEVLVDYIEHISCTIKTPAFSEEKEIRIIYDPRLYNLESRGGISLDESKQYFEEIKEKNNFTINPIRYTKKGNQLVAFCNLNFSKLINKNIINEIIIGPRSSISEDDSYNFMMSNGYDANKIKITNSEATYR